MLIYRGSTNERLSGEGVAYDSYYSETDRVTTPVHLQVEKAKGAALLLLQGVDDGLVDSKCAALIALRLRESDYYNFELHMYPETGHLLEPPYLPVCPINYHNVFSKSFIMITARRSRRANQARNILQTVFSCCIFM